MKRKREIQDYEVASYLNDRTFYHYVEYMKNIWLSSIRWKGTPSFIDQRFLEKTVLYEGSIAFFYEEIYKSVVCLPYNEIGNPDIQGNPIDIFAYSITGYTRSLSKRDKKDDFVILWDNYARVAPIETIYLFAFRMFTLQRAIDTNIENQKNPKVIAASREAKLTWENILNQTTGNVPRIMLKGDFREPPKTIDLSVPYIANDLEVEKNNVWNEFLTWCGIENANRDKRERLVQSEVNGNYGNVEVSRNVRLMPREDAANEMNEMWELNMIPVFNSQLPTMLNMPEIKEKRKKEDGKIYDNT